MSEFNQKPAVDIGRSQELLSHMPGQYEFNGSAHQQINDCDENPEMGDVYQFTQVPSGIKVQITLTPSEYEVGIMQDGDVYEYLEYGRSADHVTEILDELIPRFESDQLEEIKKKLKI